MPLRTDREQFLVHATKRTHIWLQVLHGDDAGIRLSIPRHHNEYSHELQHTIQSLNPDDLVTAELISPTENPPRWRVTELEHKQ